MCNVSLFCFDSGLSQSKHGISSAGKFKIEKDEIGFSALVESFLWGFIKGKMFFLPNAFENVAFLKRVAAAANDSGL